MDVLQGYLMWNLFIPIDLYHVFFVCLFGFAFCLLLERSSHNHVFSLYLFIEVYKFASATYLILTSYL